jgi:hypothetical protein
MAAECPLAARPRRGATGDLTLEELAAGAVVFDLLGTARNEPPTPEEAPWRLHYQC